MPSKITLPEQINDVKQIKEKVEEVIQRINVNQIYLSLGGKEHPYTYRFTIILEDMAKRFKGQAKGILNDIFKNSPECYVRFFTLNYILQETNCGSTFFLNTCTDANLIYSYTPQGSKWLFRKVEFSMVIGTAKNNYSTQKSKIQTFKKGAKLYMAELEYNQAAFMLHQTIEQSFLVLEKLLIGTSFKEHMISSHQAILGKINKNIGNLFPRENEKQIQLLQKLDAAYIKTRYSTKYEIGKKQVEKIYKRTGELQDILDEQFELEISSCTKVIRDYQEHMSIENTKSERLRASEKMDESKMLLQHLKELGKENFSLLTPIGIGEGYYLNYARIHNYSQTFTLLRSILNVSILALEDNQDQTLDIPCRELDVLRVLEFAKNLIPFEEGIFLDQTRKLLLSSDEDTFYSRKNKNNL